MGSPREMELVRHWTDTHFGGDASFFSFNYGKRSSADLIGGWKRTDTSKELDARRTQRTITYSDPVTWLQIRCVAVIYRDFPTIEWTLYLKNADRFKTPIVANLQPIDAQMAGMGFNRSSRAERSVKKVLLHYHYGEEMGSHFGGEPGRKGQQYRPLVAELTPGSAKSVATSGGRPNNEHMPFFNLEGQGAGLIMAIGWPGQWAAKFEYDRKSNLRIVAGQELTHFTLLPGEEVRTPLIALQFYAGDRIRAQNVWRRWMVAHNLPRPGGKLPAPQLAGLAFGAFAPNGHSNAQTLKLYMDTYEARKIPFDAWWIDAGWYDCDAYLPVTGYPEWAATGTWEPDAKRYPNGLREVHDHAHKKGARTIVWFEPERVHTPGTWLAQKHPEWLLKPPSTSPKEHYPRCNHLLNLGNPKALKWLINHVDALLTRERIDVYREDFNMHPLAIWRANDAADRQGITEIRHVTGHLAFWDALRRRHPNLLIDVCASGGRRNELEALRRAVPLWRSDHVPGAAGSPANLEVLAANQRMTYGISSWIPYYGSGVAVIDAYRFRSCLGMSMVFDVDPRRDDIDVDLWRRLAAQFKQVAPCLLGDYYPLAPYSLKSTAWMAWQFDCPEKGEGLVQVFRREKSSQTHACFKLHGLLAEAHYKVTDLDTGHAQHRTGRVLMQTGLRAIAKVKPAALMFRYERE